MRILIDLDNVLYDLDTPWYSRYNADYPHHILRAENIHSWDTYEYVAPECGTKIYDYLAIPEVYLEGKPYKDSQEVTKRWIDIGHEVGIVTTAAHVNAATPKLQWIAEYFPHLLKTTHITFGRTKHWYDADFLIDDAPHNLETFQGIGILYDQPWNKDNYAFSRVNNWVELEDRIHDTIHCDYPWFHYMSM